MARHKEFDRDEALQKAMEVFWARGYRAASMQNLVEHMGINRQSLYDTFGDKHSLYLQALDRY
ncbi:MAG TPA: helix-turn-helix domain-containing protein, partial [Pyrinomonadaceae bacterium]|nr:helix-turn-helix domain-containing protein [Pyrinomonadaceae bacterium]